MSQKDPVLLRVLAIDPISRGFGYVLLEGPDTLVDWGVYRVRRWQTSSVIGKLRAMIELYEPDVLVLEDCDDPRSRRRERARTLIEEAKGLTGSGLTTHLIPAWKLAELFGENPPGNKSDIAAVIARHFGELVDRLPPVRKAWMPEDLRGAIFDAAGLGLAFYVSDQPHRD